MALVNIWLYQLNTFLVLVNYFTTVHDNGESPDIEYGIDCLSPDNRRLIENYHSASIMMAAKFNMHWLEILLDMCQKLLGTWRWSVL